MSASLHSLPPTLGEEIANSITHGLGALLSLIGGIALLIAAWVTHSWWQIAACAVYGASLVLLYTASTLYHAIQHTRAKAVLQVLDHSAIYVLIAGTYTPFTLITLKGAWSWSLFAVIWTLAVAGVIFKCFWIHRFVRLSTVIYVLMGWCAIVAVKPLWDALSWRGFAWLLAGGLAYTTGVIFFAMRRRYAHAVWHLFVMAGSVCHFYAVYRYVLPERLG